MILLRKELVRAGYQLHVAAAVEHDVFGLQVPVISIRMRILPGWLRLGWLKIPHVT